MNNQAAQTMPELPAPVQRVRVEGPDQRGSGLQYALEPYFTAEQMHTMYQQGYAAALSQTAGVPVASICLVTDRRLPHFAAAEIQLYDGYEPMIGDKLYAAAPAASGGEPRPDALPDGTLSKSTAKRVTALAAASVSERARIDTLALDVARRFTLDTEPQRRASLQVAVIAALEQALTQQRGDEPAAWMVEWADNAGDPTRYIAYCEEDADDKLGVLSDGEAATAKVIPLYTTPQPSADAVRAIGWLNSDGSSYLPTEKRARMIEAGKREGASVGEVTFGKIAEDHRIALYAAPPSVAGLVTAWRDRINVDPEDPYEHGESDTLMSCADELESLLGRGG